jgi:hypothetical protein
MPHTDAAANGESTPQPAALPSYKDALNVLRNYIIRDAELVKKIGLTDATSMGIPMIPNGKKGSLAMLAHSPAWVIRCGDQYEDASSLYCDERPMIRELAHAAERTIVHQTGSGVYCIFVRPLLTQTEHGPRLEKRTRDHNAVITNMSWHVNNSNSATSPFGGVQMPHRGDNLFPKMMRVTGRPAAIASLCAKFGNRANRWNTVSEDSAPASVHTAEIEVHTPAEQATIADTKNVAVMDVKFMLSAPGNKAARATIKFTTGTSLDRIFEIAEQLKKLHIYATMRYGVLRIVISDDFLTWEIKDKISAISGVDRVLTDSPLPKRPQQPRAIGTKFKVQSSK